MDARIITALAQLEAEPDSTDALAALSSLLQGGGNGHGKPATGESAPDTGSRRALSESRRLHRERGDWELVVRLIDLELGWETDTARRADLWFEKGKIASEELLKDDEAVRAYERVRELRPDDEAAEDAIGHIALVRDNWQKIVKKYLEEAKESTDRQLTTSLYLSVAEIYAKYQPDDHVEAYLKQALEVEPRNLKASLRLERLYAGEQRWEDVCALLEQRVEAAGTKEERVQAYLALAEVQGRRRGLKAEAAESFKKALGIDPGSQKAQKALIEHYTAEENWQALVRVYENALRARPRGEPEIGMYLQLGMLWWKKLANLESADEYWKRVRKAEPAHPALLEFYRELYGKEPQKLLPILQQAQKVAEEPARRQALAVEMAQLAERSSGGVEKAIDLWKGVAKLEPQSAEAMIALKRLYQQTDKWNALLELLKERVEALPRDAVDARVEGLLEIVAIYRDKLSLDVMVINTYNNILSLKPDHLPSLQALATKYEQMGRWNDLIGVLTRTADVVQAPDDKAQLLRRIASLWIDKFGNFNQAVKPLEELYVLAPVDPETVARLRDIYNRRRSWRALIDLERKELARLDGAARREKLIEIAKLAAERLGDAREAISLWNKLLELDERDADALAALAGLYEREKRWLALIEVLRRQAANASDVKAQVALLERIGTLWAEKQAAPDQAITAYQEIVRRMPSHPKAMRTLRELYGQGGRWDDLERLYGEQGQWDELCEVLLQAAERLEDAPARIALYERVAQVATARMGAPERAAKAYERILALDGEHRHAAEMLVPIYRASEKWARLLATYEILLGHAHDDDARLALLGDIRALCEGKLGSKGLAFTWCAKAFAIRPGEAELEAELERLAAEAEAWEELAELYGADAAREADPDRKAERHRTLGRITLNRLHRPDDAVGHLEQVLARFPDDEEALATLEQIHTQAHAWGPLLAIYKKREGRAPDRERRLEMLFKVAWIEEEQVQDPAAAIATYRRVLEADAPPSARLRALRALEKLHAARGEHRELITALTRQLELADADDLDTRLALTWQIGELYELKVGDRAAALEHLRAAFQLSPTHKPTLAALERWLPVDAPVDARDRVAVAALLLPVYEQRDDARRQAECLEIALAATPADDRGATLALLQRMGALYADRLGEARRAYELTARVFDLEPGAVENRRKMAALADTLECPDDLAVRYGQAEEAAVKAGDRALATELAWDLGQVFDARLSMVDDAERAYLRVLEREPEHGDAYVALVQLYSVNERWAPLRKLLDQKRARALDSRERVSLLFQIADLDEGVLGDERAAMADYREVLEHDPASTRGWKALDRLLTLAEDWRAVDELIARRVPYAPVGGEAIGTPESRAHLSFRRGELRANRLEDPQGAAELFEAALADEPRHEGARKGLEALMKRPELRQRIARALEPLYTADEAWAKLALVLGAQREAAEGHEAAQLLSRLAQLQEERLGARQLALTTWREALRLEPGDKRVRDNVERLANLLGRLPDLAQAWEEAILASDPSDLALRGELLERVAELCEHELKDVERALAAWRRLLELDPTNPGTSRPAAAALARLHESRESWPELVAILHKQAEWADAADEKKELLFRIGRIQGELIVDPAAAVRTYREVLDVDPTDRQALDALERLHQAQREWPELVDVLRRRLELDRDAEDRRLLHWRIAGLTERELKDPGEAIAAYHALLDEKPDDMPALESLARLYEADGRAPDLLEVLERQLTLVEQHGPRPTAIRMRLAQLQEGFGRRDQALERYREVLADDPRHEGARAGLEALTDDEDLRLRAAEVLEPHYERAGEVDKLIRLSELWARYAPDPRERITRLRRIAELKEQGASAEGAFDALGRAARFAVGEPDLPQLLDRLEKVANQATRKAELVALYREIGPDILDATVQERVYLTVAAESHRLGDRATAREYYRRVLDTTPDHARSLEALEQIYAEGREHDPLFEVYARRVELAGDDGDQRRHYLVLLAQLCERELDRPSEAMRAYEQVLELFPADAQASRALEQHYSATHRHAELAELLEKRLGFADDLDEAVALRFRLAQIYDEDLSDAQRAVDNYRATLGGDPTHEGAIHALEKFLDDDALRVDAAEVLEPVYVARHDWPNLVRIYQIRLEAAALDDSAQPMRLALTKRIARLYEEQLEDLDGGFTWFGKVFREDPQDRTVRDQLARLAGILSAWDKLARLYEDWLSDRAGEEGAVEQEVLRAVALLYSARLEDVDGAKGAYKRLLTIDPGDEPAFVNLERLLTTAERWRDLLDLWREAGEPTLDVDRKKTLLYKQARVLEEKLGEPESAVELYRAVLELDADDATAIQALDRLYVAGKRWHDLVELLMRRLERVADAPGAAAGADPVVDLKLRLAGLYERELEDRTAAIDAYEEVLARSAGQSEAVRSLERLIVDRDHTFRIAQILEPIYRAQDAWQKLVVIYEAELDFIQDRDRRVALLCEIAELHEKRGGDGRLAFDALARAWDEEATEGSDHVREQSLYDDLERLARQLVRWRELVGVLDAAVDKSFDADLQARVHARVATIKEQHLGDPAGAIDSWRRVTAVHEDDADAWRALERLLESQKRPAELVAVLEKRGTLSSEVAEQKALAYRAAALYETQLSDPEAAIGTWRQVLTLDANDRQALDALDRLLRHKGAHRDLAGILQQKLELEADRAERRRLRFDLARVQEQELTDVFAAIDTYKGVLGEDAADVEALEHLARLYEGEGSWADHLDALDRLAELGSGDARTALELRAAGVVEQQLSDVEGAIRRYAGILRAHAGARQALERLVRDEATRTQAADVLEPFYVERDEPAALVEVAELRLAAESDPVARRALYQRIAELSETGLKDANAAFAVWGRLNAEDAADEDAQKELERLAEALESFATLASVYEDRLRSAFDPEVQRAYAWKLGRLYEERLGDDDKAIGAYQRALDLTDEGARDEQRQVLAALDRLLVRSGKHRALNEVLEREANAAPEPAEQAELFHRLGELRANELVDLDGALTAYRDALERAPEHAGARAGLDRLLASPAHAEAALDLLEPLYESDGDHRTLVRLGEVRLTITASPTEQVALLERIADRCERQLGDLTRALDAMARAATLDPAEARLCDEAERLAQQGGVEPQAGEIFERILGGSLPSEIARELGLRTARLWERVQDRRAEDRYRAVLELDAESREALEALDRIYRGRGDAKPLAEILGKRAELELDVQEKKRLHAEAAKLYEASLADAEHAIETWRKVLDVDEADPDALDALARLYEACGRHTDLIEALQAKARFEEDPRAQAGHKARVAMLWADKLGDVDKAVEAWRDVLDLDADSLPAMEALEELERRRSNWSAVQEVLVRKLNAVGAGAAQIPIYHQLARLALDENGAPEDAIGYLHEILAIAPDDEKAQLELSALLERTGKFHDLVDVLTQRADRAGKAGNAEAEVRLLVQAADVWEQKLGSPESATEILERILQRDAGNVRALTSLARIYEASHDLEKCRATLEKAIALATTGEELAELHFRIGRLEAELGGDEAGEPHFAEALKARPDHAEAAAALEKLARARSDWARVADLLERRELATPEADRRALYLELAGVLVDKLQKPDKALPFLERALKASPDDPAVLEPLADLYFAADRLDDALPLYRALAERMQKARRMKDVGRLRYRMAAIAEKRGDQKLAVEEYAGAHQIDPSHAPTLAALGRLHVAQAEWEKARGVYRKMLLQNLDPASGVTKAEVYLRLGEIHEHLNEGPKAVGMYERGLELDGAHAALREALARVKK